MEKFIEMSENKWHKIYKALVDKDNCIINYEFDEIPEDVTAPADAVVKTHDNDNITFSRKIKNPDFNSSLTYVRREDRKEWDAVGLMGKLRIRKGHPTAAGWIKMRDVSDTVEEWLIR